MIDEKRVVTRFAPSPTGFLHIGGARTALFNYLFAKKYGGKFILRIEDTDTARNSAEASEAILTSLRWLGLDWDEGPFYQSQRTAQYNRYAQKLLSEGKAYRCFCAGERLEALREEKRAGGESHIAYDRACLGISPEKSLKRSESGEKYVVRFKMPAGGTLSFNDMVHGAVNFQNDVLDDFIIIKSDAMPTYNFAVAIDDHEMNVTHVIRGDDHISNTPKQLAIFNALGVEAPVYAHVPMILGGDKTKLSKRHGATSLTYYEEAGYVKEALVNYLALLGWAFDGKTEFFTMDDLIEKFSEKKFGRTPAVFDIKKLEFFNQSHLKTMPSETKAGLLYNYVKKYMPDFRFDEKYDNMDYFRSVTDILGDRLKLAGDVKAYAQFMFIDDIEYPQDLIDKIIKDYGAPVAARALGLIADIAASATDYSPAALESLLRNSAIENLNFSKIAFLLRSSLAAQTVSPGIFEVMSVLGRKRCDARIKKLSDILRKQN
ncbi:MAG: Glutamate--tRNA ligase [bacterium ADurb.Bin243]|nr:MAG: Glutamate--tRNA ligase [bacterium ADurb.Bin243]